jgi:oligopeptide/dipeptide ABC transporter ATP-binding protein
MAEAIGAMTDIVLEVRNLRTTFDTERGPAAAVDGVDLVVRAGRTLCVVGESGSGKSVTALSIMRLLGDNATIDSTSEVLFDGQDLTNLVQRDLRRIRGRDIAMIFQEPMTSLDPVYTIGFQIREAIRQHQRMGRREADKRAVELMTLVGIPSPESRLKDFPHQLSGGMRQRIMIACALSSTPKVLIADEPTTALDVTIQAQILELMRDLKSRLGMAIILITHDLGVVAEMADEVAVMYGGRVVETCEVADVLHNPQHPYTEALLQSVPRLGMDKGVPLRVIPGIVPSLQTKTVGCRFEARCHRAFARCATAQPPLFRVGTQQSACWLRDDAPALPGDDE